MSSWGKNNPKNTLKICYTGLLSIFSGVPMKYSTNLSSILLFSLAGLFTPILGVIQPDEETVDEGQASLSDLIKKHRQAFVAQHPDKEKFLEELLANFKSFEYMNARKNARGLNNYSNPAYQKLLDITSMVFVRKFKQILSTKISAAEMEENPAYILHAQRWIYMGKYLIENSKNEEQKMRLINLFMSHLNDLSVVRDATALTLVFRNFDGKDRALVTDPRKAIGLEGVFHALGQATKIVWGIMKGDGIDALIKETSNTILVDLNDFSPENAVTLRDMIERVNGDKKNKPYVACTDELMAIGPQKPVPADESLQSISIGK